MNYKGLQKLSELYQKLKDLDAEIIILDKLAMQMTTDKTSVDLTLSVLNLTKKESEPQKAEDEESQNSFHKSLMENLYSIRLNYGVPSPTEEEKHKKKYSAIIDDISGIQIVGLLIMNKQELRSKIVAEIKQVDWGTVK